MTSSTEHSSFRPITPRHLALQEAAWIRDIVLANPVWAGVSVDDVLAVAECTCGCRSVALAPQTEAGTLAEDGRQDLVGQIDLTIRFNGQEDIVSVLLHRVCYDHIPFGRLLSSSDNSRSTLGAPNPASFTYPHWEVCFAKQWTL